MIAASPFDQYLDRIAGGADLEPAVVETLAASPDILPAGMLADALKRRLHGSRVTFLRVAICPFDHSFADAVPPAAREVRIAGAPESLDVALSAISSARAVAGERALTGFSWADVERFASAADEKPIVVLTRLRDAGLGGLAEAALDTMTDPAAAIEAMAKAGFERVRLHVAKMSGADRTALWLNVGALQRRFKVIDSINPLPLSLSVFKPTTGYDDVKAVAIARLAAPQVPHVQVDWLRYGPKLAQVALTFGADDVDGVSASDAAPEGRRRAPLEEIRRNIEAAGFEPVERAGWTARPEGGQSDTVGQGGA
jgi:aminodeoxyfutalosine synthase